MRTIGISDITLRKHAGKDGAPLSFNEKTQIVKALSDIGVDVIETAPILEGKTDVLFLHTVSPLSGDSVLCCPAGLTEASVEETCEAVKGASRPRVQIPVPVSTVQMEYLCKKKPPKMLELLEALTKKACSLCGDVEVSLLDATRAEPEFLVSAVRTAIESGAKTVSLCDDAGLMLPQEFGDMIRGLVEQIPELSGVTLCVECSDALHMAAADALSACLAGAGEIKTSVGKGTASLSDIAHIFRSRGENLGIKTGLDFTQIDRAARTIGGYLYKKHAASSPFDAGTGREHGVDFSLGADADLHEVSEVISHMGYILSDEDLKNVYDEFRKTAEKKTVGPKEMDTIIATTAMQVPSTYKLVSYVINNGDIITPTANIMVLKDEVPMRGFCVGDGPIDAAFLAIEQISGHHYELDDFRVQAITGGADAVGSCLVRLRHNGKLYSGSGVSTDIVGACIKAYLNALNKISYEEKN